MFARRSSSRLKLIEEAVRRGHEIASHTLTHRALTTLSAEQKRNEIFASRDRLHAAFGSAPAGFRAPGFHMDAECLDLLAEAGYRYDSSFFPGARVTQQPHRPMAGTTLLELPMPGCAPLPFPFHPCFSLVLGMTYYRLALRRFRSRNAPLVFLFHLTDFADPLPPTHLRGWGSKFYTLSHLTGTAKRGRCRRMLDEVRKSFRIVTTQELLDNYL